MNEIKFRSDHNINQFPLEIEHRILQPCSKNNISDRKLEIFDILTDKENNKKISLTLNRKVILYKIKDKDGKTVGYLLPTIHQVQDTSLQKFKPKVMKSLFKSRKVWLESQFSTDEIKKGAFSSTGIDQALGRYTLDLKKELSGIETDEYLGTLDLENVIPAKTNYTDVLDQILYRDNLETFYKNGEYFKINKLIKEDRENFVENTPYFVVLDKRNRNMAKIIHSELKENSATGKAQKLFFSAGAAHFIDMGSAHSLQHYLRKEGWSIHPVI